MDPITSGNRNRPTDPRVYWRRRVVALAAGLGVLGLLAWAIGGSGPHPTAADTALHDRGSRGSVSSTGSSPAPVEGSTTSPASDARSPSPSPAATAGTAGWHGRRDARSPAARPSPGQSKAGTSPALDSRGGTCPAASVVISLTASSDSYASSVQPAFTVDVVSTGTRPCLLNVGGRYLTVVIKSGSVREWGSADCIRVGGSALARLARGVPVQRHIIWDRLLSAAGCPPHRSPARPGTYTVTAADGSLHSGTLVFVLR